MESPTQAHEAPVKVTIIVPVYNVEPYIRDALESLKRQTLSGIEVLIVDDRGTDGSMIIAQEFADADPRFRIIVNPENLGLAASRQRGIELATGEYIGFLDSDDWVDDCFFSGLYDVAAKIKADIVQGSIEVHSLENKTKRIDPTPSPDGHRPDLGGGSYSGISIYRRNFLQENDISFPDLRYGEDATFVLTARLKCRAFGISTQGAYHYRLRPGSLTSVITYLKLSYVLEGTAMLADTLNSAHISKADYCRLFHTLLMGVCFEQIGRAFDESNEPVRSEAVAVSRLREIFAQCKWKDDLLRSKGNLYYDFLLSSGEVPPPGFFSKTARPLRYFGGRLPVRWKNRATNRKLVIMGFLPIYSERISGSRVVTRIFGIPFGHRPASWATDRGRG